MADAETFEASRAGPVAIMVVMGGLAVAAGVVAFTADARGTVTVAQICTVLLALSLVGSSGPAIAPLRVIVDGEGLEIRGTGKTTPQKFPWAAIVGVTSGLPKSRGFGLLLRNPTPVQLEHFKSVGAHRYFVGANLDVDGLLAAIERRRPGLRAS